MSSVPACPTAASGAASGGANTAMPVLVTGSAGFIGMHVTRALLARGESVVGIDNLKLG